jgi:hypothetical protein
LLKPYLFRLSSVLSVLGVHAIVSTSTLVLAACFSLLVMFDVLFYSLHVFLHDRRQNVVRGRTSAELSSKGEYLVVGERQVTLTTLLSML